MDKKVDSLMDKKGQIIKDILMDKKDNLIDKRDNLMDKKDNFMDKKR